MNEKILEIFEQVADNLDPEDCMVSEEFLKVFGESIVKECASVCESATQEGQPLHLVSIGYADRIKQHFGVEQ